MYEHTGITSKYLWKCTGHKHVIHNIVVTNLNVEFLDRHSMDNLHCSHHQACHSPPVLHFNTPDHHCYHAIRDGNDEKRINRRDQRCKKISQIYHIISTDTICKVIITSQIEGFKLARNVKTYGTYLLQSTLIKNWYVYNMQPCSERDSNFFFLSAHWPSIFPVTENAQHEPQ